MTSSSRIVVITGASSGIGKATAIAFAERGDTVVLAARRGPELEETAQKCHEAGGKAVVVVTDVTSEAEVTQLFDTALAIAGRIDVWVNNAGVTLFATLEQGPSDAHKRVIETNVFGAMYCARAVVPHFRRQGRGVLINVGSVLSHIGQAMVPSYVISKFALRGLTEALRSELADYPDVHVCSVFPYAVDTPHFESGANFTGEAAHAMQPVQQPHIVASAIVDVADRPRRVRFVPRYIVLGLALHTLMPRRVEKVLLHALERFHIAGRDPPKEGNLYTPEPASSGTRGKRPPIVSALRFFAWAALEMVKA